MLKQTNQLGWATGRLRDLYLAADNRGAHVWRVCQAFGKDPEQLRPEDCMPVLSFRAPGIVVLNSFGNRTEALRVSEHSISQGFDTFGLPRTYQRHGSFAA